MLFMVGELKRYQKAALTDNFYAPSAIGGEVGVGFSHHRVQRGT